MEVSPVGHMYIWVVNAIIIWKQYSFVNTKINMNEISIHVKET